LTDNVQVIRLAWLAVAAVLLSGCSGPAAGSGVVAPPTSGPASRSTAPSPTLPCTQASAIDAWPLRRLAAQVLVAPAQLSNVEASAPQVADGVGGLILFGSSVAPDFSTSLDRLTSSAPEGVPPLVMTDEEGGAVQRVLDLVGPVPSARRMARTMTPTQISALAHDIGQKLAAAGITMDLAPVLDLDNRPGPSSRNPDGTRSFGMNVQRTSADAVAFAEGLERAGVIPVVKHFPGLGSATGNTDSGPASTLPWATLSQAGLVPFRDAVKAGVPAVMVANATVPGLTDQPASISTVAIDNVLRDSLHFTGLVMTDSVSAGALRDIGYDVPQATVAALNAGADMVLFGTGINDDPRLTMQTVRSTVTAVRTGSLSRARLEQAVSHVLAAKHVRLCAR
jgi:beta-N-acetylhexosaminidase